MVYFKQAPKKDEATMATNQRVTPENIIKKLDTLIKVVVDEGETYPGLRPAEQTKKILECLYKKPDGSIESDAAELVKTFLAGIYSENPNRSDSEALAVLSASIASISEIVYGDDKYAEDGKEPYEIAAEVLFDKEQLAQFIVDNREAIEDFIPGRTGCLNSLQQHFPFAEYISSLNEKPAVLHVSCGPNGIAGHLLSYPEKFLDEELILEGSSGINLEELRKKFGTESIASKYLGLDVLPQHKDEDGFVSYLKRGVDQDKSYDPDIQDPDQGNDCFFINLSGLTTDESGALEPLVEKIENIDIDYIEDFKKNTNFRLQQMDPDSLLDNKDKITEYLGENSVIYVTAALYPPTDKSLESILKFAADTGYELVLHGKLLFHPSDKNIYLTKYNAIRDELGNVVVSETPLYRYSDPLGHSYEKVESDII